MHIVDEAGTALCAAILVNSLGCFFNPTGVLTTEDSVTAVDLTGVVTMEGVTQGATDDSSGGSTGPATTDATSSDIPDDTTGATGGAAVPDCDSLGGMNGIGSLVVTLNQVLRSDERINAYFLNQSFVPGKFEACLATQIGEAVGCEGVTYDCGDMQEVHAGLGISAVDHADFVEDFTTALTMHEQSLGIDLGEAKAGLVAMFASTAIDVVEDPGNNLSVYQRIGRNPTLLELVGSPTAEGSFLQRLTSSASLGGYFDVLDAARSTHCYSRRIGSLDGIGGPMKYGQEVIVMPACADIGAVHTGLTNSLNGDAPIGIQEFMEMLAELNSAMEQTPGTAQADPADREVIHAAVASLCEQIVAMPNDCSGTSESTEAKAVINMSPVDIPDFDGNNVKPLCVMIPVPATGIDKVMDARVQLSAYHPWAGDLVITLATPDAKALKLLARPGVTMMNQVGFGAVLDPGKPITFSDGGFYNASSMGSGYAPGQKVCDKENPCSFFPPQTGDLITKFSQLKGTDAPGDWQLCVSDYGAGQFGKLHAVTLELDKVKYWP